MRFTLVTNLSKDVEKVKRFVIPRMCVMKPVTFLHKLADMIGCST